MVVNSSPSTNWKQNFKFDIDRRKLKIGIRDYFQSFLPILTWIFNYPPRWIINDVIAGLTVCLVLIPQSLAYAKLAEVPLQYGLTSSFMPLFFYTLTGTSRELSMGPTAIVSLATGKIVLELAHSGYSAIQVASAVAFWSGIILMVLGVTRLGKILDLIPDPVIIGFINGAALNIAATQFPKIFGLDISTNQSSIMIIYRVLESIGSTKVIDLVLAIASFVFLLFMKFGVKFGKRKWDQLKYLGFAANGMAVVLFTLIVYGIKSANSKADIHIVGNIPNNLSVSVPSLDLEILRLAGTEMVPLCLVVILEHVALVKGLSKKFGYVSNSSQELISLGGGNLLNSFFFGIPVTGSLSRSSIQSQAGAQSPLANITSGVIILIVLKFLTPLFYYLPLATLSAMIILAVLNLLEGFHMYKYLLLCCPSDLVIFLCALIVTFVVNAEIGILASMILTFLKLMYYLTRPYMAISSNQDPITHRNDIQYPSDLNENHGVMIFQPQMSIIFLNAQSLGDRMLDYALLHCKPPPKTSQERKIWSMDLAEKGEKLRKDEGISPHDESSLFPLRGVILDFLHVQFLDYSGIKVLIDLKDSLQHIYTPPDQKKSNEKLPFHFVHVKPHIMPQLVHGGLLNLDNDVHTETKQSIIVDEEDDLMVEHNGMTVRSTNLHHTVENALHDLFQSHSVDQNVNHNISV